MQLASGLSFNLGTAPTPKLTSLKRVEAVQALVVGAGTSLTLTCLRAQTDITDGTAHIQSIGFEGRVSESDAASGATV